MAANPNATAASGNNVGTDFYMSLLAAIGAPSTSENLAFLANWHPFELSTASWNPFNTTQPAAGASNINDAGVKSYTSQAQGVTATAQTLQNGFYPNLIAALKSGDPLPRAGSFLSDLRKWGSGNFANALAAGGRVATSTQTTTTPAPLPPAVPPTASGGSGPAGLGSFLFAAMLFILALVLLIIGFRLLINQELPKVGDLEKLAPVAAEAAA